MPSLGVRKDTDKPAGKKAPNAPGRPPKTAETHRVKPVITATKYEFATSRIENLQQIEIPVDERGTVSVAGVEPTRNIVFCLFEEQNLTESKALWPCIARRLSQKINEFRVELQRVCRTYGVSPVIECSESDVCFPKSIRKLRMVEVVYVEGDSTSSISDFRFSIVGARWIAEALFASGIVSNVDSGDLRYMCPNFTKTVEHSYVFSKFTLGVVQATENPETRECGFKYDTGMNENMPGRDNKAVLEFDTPEGLSLQKTVETGLAASKLFDD